VDVLENPLITCGIVDGTPNAWQHRHLFGFVFIFLLLPWLPALPFCLFIPRGYRTTVESRFDIWRSERKLTARVR